MYSRKILWIYPWVIAPTSKKFPTTENPPSAFLPHSSPYKIHPRITTPSFEQDIKTPFQCLQPWPNEENCIIKNCFPSKFLVVKDVIVPMTPNTPCYRSPQHHPSLPINSAAFTVPMLQKMFPWHHLNHWGNPNPWVTLQPYISYLFTAKK